MIQISIMGYGVVGSGVAEVITSHAQSLSLRVGDEINIKYILDVRKFPDSPLKDKFISDFDTILNDDEIKVVVETIGGLKPAYEYVKKCLLSGKSVVTSNKELIAEKGHELLSIAKKNNVNLLFEASVGGGIPILRPINQCLAANDVEEIAGILNGTTNYILSKMVNEHMAFEDALSSAQALGYAEKNPDADILGFDTCRKICIMSSLAYGKHIYPHNIPTKGIDTVTLYDTKYAASFGGVIKLIGRAKKLQSGKLDIAVSPMLIKNEHLLSSVGDVFNAILVKGDAAGDIIFYGKGAGKLPTASAVVADVIDCLKHISARKQVYWEDGDGSELIAAGDSLAKMYLRFKVNDKNSAYKRAFEIFGNIDILTYDSEESNQIAFVTNDEMSVSNIQEKTALLEKDGNILCSSFRIADF